MKESLQTRKSLIKNFKIKRGDEYYELSLKNCPNKIKIKVPFVLDENVATLAGMMPDGSLIKDLRRVYFAQKKDFNKNLLFKHLIIKLFNPNNKIFIREGKNCYETYTNSTVLCNFLYYILDFKKSDEEMRVPYWIFNSPDSVKRAYLKEAFAMEGTIFKSLTEIRFITKDYNFANDIKELLKSLGIHSFMKERIGGTHKTIQYRISIYRKENFQKFKRIGFTNPLHVDRFNKICIKYDI
ncbi:MAG: LAGLIDADG family homing endonuclease [Nanoarchaeota archaeon]